MLSRFLANLPEYTLLRAKSGNVRNFLKRHTAMIENIDQKVYSGQIYGYFHISETSTWLRPDNNWVLAGKRPSFLKTDTQELVEMC